MGRRNVSSCLNNFTPISFLAGLSLAPALSLAQQEGYNYDPPDNPLVITRPEQPTPAPAPRRPPPPQQPRPQPEVDQGRKAEPQQGGGGHHHDSDDPLAWLRDSVPGKLARYAQSSVYALWINI